jgi:uncharacterized membrane protein YpjA
LAAIDLRTEACPIRWGPWIRISRWVVSSRILWVIVGIDLASAVAGYVIWYGGTILSSPWYFWPFVPDSPLAVTFVAAVLIAFRYGRRWELLGLLAVGTCVKYGLWTVLVWFTKYLSGGGYSAMAIVMSVSHFCMIIEGLIVAALLRFRPIPVAIAGLFLILNDLVDYASSYHPRLPELVDGRVVARFSVATTAVVIACWIAMSLVAARRSQSGSTPIGGASSSDSGGA